MIEASCHCGAVRIEIAVRPESLTDCNCSVCRRYGALWAYYRPDQVRFLTPRDTTLAYAHGEKSIAFHHCRVCGCVTHWENVNKVNADRMAVNARLCEPLAIEGVAVRRFDGAESWAFLD